MPTVISQPPHLRLAIAPGVTSSRLSDLLALQRAEEPEVTIALLEVRGDEILAGLKDGHYDAAMSLQGATDSALHTQPLWIEHMAVAMPLRSSLMDHAKLAIADLLDHPVFRWQAESCPLLDQRLSSLPAVRQQSTQYVASFEMLALKVAAGYGVGISTQSRIERAHGWGLSMRSLADGPYEVVTYLQRPYVQATPATDRIERRALQVAVTI